MNVEQLLIGSLIMNRGAYEDLVSQGLVDNMFTSHADVFRALVDFYSDHTEVPSVSIATLKVPGWTSGDLATLIDFPEGEGSYLYQSYFYAVRSAYLDRSVTQHVNALSEYTPESVAGTAEYLSQLAAGTMVDDRSTQSIADNAMKIIESKHKEGYHNEYSTAWFDFNRLGHLERGSLYILGGESGHGKSTLALNLTSQWVDEGRRGLYFSREMSAEVCLMKLTCIRTRIPWDRVIRRDGQGLDPMQWNMFYDSMYNLATKSLRIITSTLSMAEMEILIKNYKPDFFVLDTVNDMIGTQERQDIHLGNIARAFKRWSIRYNTLAIIIAQLKETTDRPTNKNLVKESRQIKDAADYMDYIYRQEEHSVTMCPSQLKGVMEVFRVKGRLVGVGTTYLSFDGPTGFISYLSAEHMATVQAFIGRSEQ
jgi:replicative DNA helicase